jgi:drug/metabolite transporter (DMT)-like permease
VTDMPFQPASRVAGMAMVATAAIMISFGAPLARLIEDADAWQISVYRPGTIGLVVGAFLIFLYRGDTARKVIGVGRWGWAAALAMAVAGATFIQAITLTTVAATLFTMSAIPFFSAGLAWLFLRERPDRVTLAAMTAAVVGVALMIGEGFGAGGGTLTGNLMALATAVGFAVYAVIVRAHREVDMLPVVALSGLILAVFALIVTGGDWAISWWDFWMCFLWGGVLSGIGYCLFVIAARVLLAAEVTLILLLEFSLGPLWVWLFIGETPTAWTLGGGVLIMTAVIARTLWETRRK